MCVNGYKSTKTECVGVCGTVGESEGEREREILCVCVCVCVCVRERESDREGVYA
jgi:hypothetical protein